MDRPFVNAPETDFSEASNVEAFREALDRVEARLGAEYPNVIGGEEVEFADRFSSTNPARPDQVVGTFPAAEPDDARRAIRAADEAFESWSRTPAAERAEYLFGVAAKIRERRHELSAWMVYEVGKSWAEADGEVAEASDLLEYYGREMLRLDGSQTEHLATIPEEETDFFYIPLGVGVVISPWNFPMALTFGMASAALVAGNTVVIKPASTSPVSVYQVAKIFWELGLPPGVLNLVTGSGSRVGDPLVEHPRTRFVAFTGSKPVGLGIHEKAAKVQPGQIWIKRTVLELGGKNAVIVDEDADLEAAVEGVVASAFGFQGQKCSAGSRAIVDDAVYDEFMERLVDRVADVKAGDPREDREVLVGPVIDETAYGSILEYIDIGKQEGELVAGGGPAEGPGYLIQPTVFADVDPDARIAQEEIFGPVLACIRAQDFDDALRIANSTQYGLTGSLYSRDPEKRRRARREFHVGNLYLNRKSTGALMGVHPFGGFNMSGTDSKAGGPDYLLHFLQAKAVGERKEPQS